MSSRFSFLMVLALLLVASLASAQTAIPAASGNDTPVFMTPDASNPDCAQAELPQQQPAPKFMADTCGTCSDTLCQGAVYGAVCRISGVKVYQCLNVFGQNCSDPPSSSKCRCWHGPLP